MSRLSKGVKQENSHRHVCQWPDCPFFASIEKSHGPHQEFKALCTQHGAKFDLLGFAGIEKMNWRPAKLRAA